MNDIERTSKGRFVKGTSGNRKGRPKKPRPFTQALQDIAANYSDGEGGKVDVWRKLAQIAFQRAMEGDLAWAKIVLEYGEGKPRQVVEEELDNPIQAVAAHLAQLAGGTTITAVAAVSGSENDEPYDEAAE